MNDIMEFSMENCLRMKEEKRKDLKRLPIDEKIRIVENLRERVIVIRNLRYNRGKQFEESKRKTGITPCK